MLQFGNIYSVNSNFIFMNFQRYQNGHALKEKSFVYSIIEKVNKTTRSLNVFESRNRSYVFFLNYIFGLHFP